MTGHPREGATALLSYKISKGPELSNPMDPNSNPTGNTIFVLNEVYESPAGVAEHWKQAVETWQDLPAFMDWGPKGNVSTLHSGTVVQAHWQANSFIAGSELLDDYDQAHGRLWSLSAWTALGPLAVVEVR